MRHIISAVGLALAAASATAADGMGNVPITPMWVWLCAGAATVVFGTIVYSVIAYRPPVTSAAPQQQRRPAREILWASVPIAITIAAALPALTIKAPLDHMASVQAGQPLVLCAEAVDTLPSGQLPGSIPDLHKHPAPGCTTQR